MPSLLWISPSRCLHLVDSKMQLLWPVITTTVITVLDNHASLKIRTIKQRNSKPWYSDAIHVERQRRRQCERNWLKTRLEMHRQLYVQQQQQRVVRVINTAKKEYYSDTLATAAPADAQKCLKDLLYSVEQRLPPHDSEQELADSFV